jgi:CRISPR-associated protein Cas5d
VLKPIRLMSVLRNEVQSKVSPVAVKKWMRDASTFEPLVAGAGNGTDGTPRNTTLLRDVAYWIDAYPHVFDTSGDNTPVKYVEMMRRRVEKGAMLPAALSGLPRVCGRVWPSARGRPAHPGLDGDWPDAL